MTDELKKIIDEAEVFLSFLNKNHIKYVRSSIRQAYYQGRLDELQRKDKNEPKKN
jgi:hypothetical protein